ncbi:MAG: hypothetical protein Q9183_002152, partial [Haloplaca sp. 2 TL-2023]
MIPKRSQRDPFEEIFRDVSEFMRKIQINRREHPTKTDQQIMEMSRRGAPDTEEEYSDSPDEESAAEVEEVVNPDEEATSKTSK